MPAFNHNIRLLVLSSLSTLILLDAADTTLKTTAAIGVIVIHALHSTQAYDAAFIALCTLTLVQAVGHGVNAFLILGASMRACGLALLSATYTLLLGGWAALQFEWLSIEQPAVARFIEATLFALLPLPCAILPTWASAALFGAAHTHVVLAAAFGAAFWVTGTGAPSTYPLRRADEPACLPAATAVHAATLVLLPTLYYVILHHASLSFEWDLHRWTIAALVATPCAAIASMPAKYVEPWASAALVEARGGIQLLSLGVLSCCAHHALLNALPIYLPHPSAHRQLLPASFVAPLLGIMLNRRNMAHFSAISLLASLGSLAFALAFGVTKFEDLGVLLLLNLAATRFGFSRDAASAVCALCAALWLLRRFLWHALGLRDGWSATHVLIEVGVGVRGAAEVVMVHATLALGAAAASLRRRVPSRALLWLLLAHACALSAAEWAMREQRVYPTPLLLLSLGCGALLCERVQAEHAPCAPTAWWLLVSAHSCRATLLVTSDAATVAAAAVLSAALLQPLHTSALRRARRRHTRPIEAIARVALVVLGVVLSAARLLPLLLSPLLLAETQASSSSSASSSLAPSPSLLGASLVLAAVGCSQALGNLPASSLSLLSRLSALVVADGFCLMLLQPPLDLHALFASISWTLAHPTASVSFGGTPQLLLWPPWLIIIIITITLAAALGLIPSSSSSSSSSSTTTTTTTTTTTSATGTAARLLALSVVGGSTALSACGALLPLERSLYAVHAAAAAVALPMLVAAAAPRALPLPHSAPAALFVSLLLLLPIGLYLVEAACAHARALPRARSASLLDASRASYLSIHGGSFTLLALLLKLRAASLLPAPSSSSSSSSSAAALAPLRGGGAAPPWGTPTQRRLQRRVGGAHAQLPVLGNAATLASVALIMVAHVGYLDGSARAIVVVAPLLLLLHPHAPPFRQLSHATRHAPAVCAISIVLSISAGLNALFRQTSVEIAISAILAACAVPSQALYCHFLWTRRRHSELVLLGAAALSLLPLCMTAQVEVFDAALAAVVCAAAHIVCAKRVQSDGMRYI